MRFLALGRERPGIEWDGLSAELEQEAEAVWKLHTDGVLREIYFTAERSEVVLLLDCGDEQQAWNALRSLPLVRLQLIGFELKPLEPYTGYERLFRKDYEA
jgi:hypothetical protein